MQIQLDYEQNLKAKEDRKAKLRSMLQQERKERDSKKTKDMQEKLENYRRQNEHSLSMKEQNFVDKTEEIDIKREVVKRFNDDQV